MSEHVVRIGSNRLVGVVSEPEAKPDGERPGVVLLNSGLIQRVGPNRLYVQLARRLAAQGHPVLRFDLSAIGDSPRRLDNLPFQQSAIEETREAMETLRAGWGAERFVLAGICTGAVVAYRTARQDDRVIGIGMVNAQGLLQDEAREITAYVDDQAASHYYLGRALLRPRSWKKLVAGRANLGAIARACGQRLRGLAGQPPGLDTPEANDIADSLQGLARERHLLLMYAEGDPGYDELAAIMGRRWPQLRSAPGTTLRRQAGADHMFTPLAHQRRFLDEVGGWVEAIRAPSTSPTTASPVGG